MYKNIVQYCNEDMTCVKFEVSAFPISSFIYGGMHI